MTAAVPDLWDARVAAYTEGVDWLIELAGAVGSRWAEPGLGVWDLRALVGHTGRSLVTVLEHLERPAPAAVLSDAADYYRAARELVAGPGVAERGVAAGAALGADPVASLQGLRGRALAALAGCDGSEIVTTIVGGLRLADYLVTRCVELAVHGCDIAVALDLPGEPPPSCAAQALAVVTALAVADGRAGPLLLASTGRRGVPEGFSVL